MSANYDSDSSPELDESEFFDAQTIDEAEQKANEAAQGSNVLPLIPTDFTSIDEAMHNFAVVFESRYGANHPLFYNMSLEEAMMMAFEIPGGEIMDRKPLVLYLHNDQSVAAHIFAQSLCSDAISNFLQKQFVCWAWDVTQSENRTKLFEWLTQANMDESVGQHLREVPLQRYPLLVALIKDRGSVSVASTCFGHDDVSTVIDKLMRGLEMYQEIRQKDVEEEQGRIERELFRQEQAEEYQLGLAMDMAKKEQRDRERAAQLLVENEVEEKKARLESIRNDIRSKMSSNEEVSGANGVVRIRVQFPNGSRIVKNFNPDDSLELLFNTVFINQACPEQFTLLIGYPQKPLTQCVPQWYLREFEVNGSAATGDGTHIPTFMEAKIGGSVAVLVQTAECALGEAESADSMVSNHRQIAEFLGRQFREHQLTGRLFGKCPDEMRSLALTYTSYLESKRHLQALRSKYLAGERSVEKAAELVGLQLPPKQHKI